MPTSRKSAKKRTKAAKKSASKKGSARTALRKAVPPPDNPLLRHEENDFDRRIFQRQGLEGGARKSSKKGARAVAMADLAVSGEEREGEVSSMAKLRLAALATSRQMPEADPGAPILIAPALTGIEMVAPVAGVSNWVQMGPTAIPKGQTYSAARVLVTGRVTSIVVDPTAPNTIYCGTAQGGVWKTTDGGKNWVAKSDNELSLAIGALAIDPGNPLTLYAGTGEGNFSGDSYYGNGVLKTTDGGNSWTTLATSTFTGARFGRICVTPAAPARLFGATSNGLYRSTDAGMNWSKMTGGLPNAPATDVAIDPLTPTTVYAAFWEQGIYRCTNASAAAPTWTKLTGGLPASGLTRIGLGLSPSSPQTIYALIADSSYTINGFYRTTDGGNSWTAIPLPGGNIGAQGFYNLHVAVDPTTPDIVYLSGVAVWKATRNSASGAWTINNVGATIHPDNHAFAFHPANHLIVYAGNDGGIYRSTNGGVTWDDTINEGLCIMQCEFIDQHPTSDAVVFSGTQDNGTEQFRNSTVFYHADDGDGGHCAVDKAQPKNVLSTYYGPSPKRSTQAGKFGTWMNVAAGIAGSGLFYPPMALDETNSNNVAFGTDRINLDPAQGASGWPTKVTLPSINGSVSAIHYTNSNMIYVGTSTGRVYRLTKSGATWTATAIHAAPLPVGPFITDLASVPGSPDTVIVVMSGFGTGHVWRGVVPAAGAATWTNISGSGASAIPDIPANALVIDPAIPNTFYVATDVAIYRTTNGGTSWTQFSQGLPNCAVFDMRLHSPTRLLRAGTHGRGIWERKLDVPSVPDVDIFFRDHLMSTGRILPTPNAVPAAFEDPLQYVNLGDPLSHWMCADIKVDALEGSPPSYQMSVASVDYVAYETRLQHRNAQRGNVNRVYVKVNNRGFAPGANVTVKLLYANASAGLPPLPGNFWTAFPGNSSDTTNWKPVGAAKTILTLSPTEPTILEWDLALPPTAAPHSCLLVVMDCPQNPIPATSKIFNVDQLVRNEKRVGLKNLHVVNIPAGAMSWTTLDFNPTGTGKLSAIRVVGTGLEKGSLGFLLPESAQTTLSRSLKKTGKKKAAKKSADAAAASGPEGISVRRASEQMIKLLKEHLPDEAGKYDLTRLYTLEKGKGGGKLSGVKIPKGGLRAAVVLTAPMRGTDFETFSVVQEEDGEIIGGSTYVIRPEKG
ncbi:MAG TPA: hypothetical protein VF528_19840 [Pyrinomonadaceae bacterium]